MVAYNNKKFYIDIVETKPSSAISIIETDCEVDFAPPLDYIEPEKPLKASISKKRPPEDQGSLSFFLLSRFCPSTELPLLYTAL